jgi:hypothetical protein
LRTRLVFAAGASPDLEEPIPVPSGYGFVLDEAESTNATHEYASKTLLGHEKAAAKAKAAIIDYYVTRLQHLGWTVVSLGDGAELKAPDSDVGIRVYAYLGIPPWGAGRGTLSSSSSARNGVPTRTTASRPGSPTSSLTRANDRDCHARRRARSGVGCGVSSNLV